MQLSSRIVCAVSGMTIATGFGVLGYFIFNSLKTTDRIYVASWNLAALTSSTLMSICGVGMALCACSGCRTNNQDQTANVNSESLVQQEQEDEEEEGLP